MCSAFGDRDLVKHLDKLVGDSIFAARIHLRILRRESSTLPRDTEAITCSQGPTGAFDDHLADVTVPVLYVGAGGGFGRAGLYSLSLLGSKDTSTHIVSFPPDKAAFDFSNVDLFQARHAQQLLWKPIYDWLVQHGPRPV